MKVIAITERGGDFTIAVVKIPEGKTADEVFLAWMKAGCKGGSCGYNLEGKTDEEIFDINTEYAFSEQSIQE